MRTFKDIQDLTRRVSGWIEGYDMSCYNCDYDTLLDDTCENLWRWLKANGWNYGDELPEIDIDEFINDYEE